MREAGRITARALSVMANAVKPGMTTADLDKLAFDYIKSAGAKPAFLNYGGFPGTVCISVNEEIVHGFPSAKRHLKAGDIVSLDMGAVVDGFYGDSAITVPVGKASPEARRLMDLTKESLAVGLAHVRAGVRLGVVSNAIQEFAEGNGLGVIREFTGHGVGRDLHEDPSIPNYGSPKSGPVLREGMTLAIEPMLSLGTWKVRIKENGWTAVTADGSLSAHFEHTVAVTKDGCEILTKE